MLLILSGGYISNEMQSEFGRIPPIFLPLAGKSLLQYQVGTYKDKNIFLALPSCYRLSPAESILVGRLDVKIISVDHEESLSHCVLQCLDYLSHYDNPITILFGDTLIPPEDSLSNIIGISHGLIGFYWASFNKVSETFEENKYLREDCLVLNGYFKFKDISILRKALINADNNFITAVNSLMEDDHVHTLEMDHWLDFGHLHSYFISRKHFTSERCFNSLSYKDGFFTKSADNSKKILAEKKWYELLEKPLQVYVPAVHSNNDNSYEIEYLYHLPLSELYLSCRLGGATWARIIDSCFYFLEKLHSFAAKEEHGNWVVTKKTEDRISSLPAHVGVLIEQGLRKNGETLENVILKANNLIADHTYDPKYVHGDFCFSNILYDFRSNRIKVIDPRGCDFNGNTTVYGDPLYDYAKLAHSCIGKYDDIVAGRYNQEHLSSNFSLELIDSEESVGICDAFIRGLDKRNINQRVIYGHMVHLFLSMIPLHNDSSDRQLAFALNALRLLREAEKL